MKIPGLVLAAIATAFVVVSGVPSTADNSLWLTSKVGQPSITLQAFNDWRVVGEQSAAAVTNGLVSVQHSSSDWRVVG